MRNPFSTLLYLIFGYVCGLIWEPSLFSANIPNTQWHNIWVYVWIIGWPFMLLYLYVWPLLLVAINESRVR